MLTVGNIIQELNLLVFQGSDQVHRPVKGAYAGDLLSDVMGKAREGELWVTMQTHRNIIAVASLKELSAILIVNGGKPDSDTIAAAAKEGVVLLGSEDPSFDTCGKLYQRMTGNALV
jgi:hypothetical protein